MSLASAKEKKKEKNAGREKKQARVSYQLSYMLASIFLERSEPSRKWEKVGFILIGVSRKNQPWNQKIIILFLRWCNACINFVWILSNSFSTLQTNITIACILRRILLLYAFYYIFLCIVCFSFQSLRYQSFWILLHWTKNYFTFYIQKWKKNINLICVSLKYHKFSQAFISLQQTLLWVIMTSIYF